jgi:hypothetical protein
MRRLDGTSLKPSVVIDPDRLGNYEMALFYEIASEFEPACIEIGSAKGMSKEEMRDFSVAGRVVHRMAREFNVEHLAILESGAIAHVDVAGPRTGIRVAAESAELARTELEKIIECIGSVEEPDDSKLQVRFWSKTPEGPKASGRTLDVIEWDQAQENYSMRTHAAVESLANGFAATRSGMILWHGEPGTGKSRAVEAVVNSWREWCDVHFVTDPEEFLWHGSWYLMQVINARQRVRRANGGELELEKWQLIVLEDSGELLSADSAQRTGQGLQRLLNLTDGAMGRGMKVIVLVTTNEPFNKLHGAVTRPGRCLQVHEFDRLSVDESNGWLRAHDLDETASRPMTIAELYGTLNDESQPAEPPRAVGFAA